MHRRNLSGLGAESSLRAPLRTSPDRGRGRHSNSVDLMIPIWRQPAWRHLGRVRVTEIPRLLGHLGMQEGKSKSVGARHSWILVQRMVAQSHLDPDKPGDGAGAGRTTASKPGPHLPEGAVGNGAIAAVYPGSPRSSAAIDATIQTSRSRNERHEPSCSGFCSSLIKDNLVSPIPDAAFALLHPPSLTVALQTSPNTPCFTLPRPARFPIRTATLSVSAPDGDPQCTASESSLEHPLRSSCATTYTISIFVATAQANLDERTP